MGQIKQVAKHFYEQDIEIELVSEELDGETMHNIFQLTFDNQAYVEHESLRSIMKKESQLPIRASIIFELFPFCIVFSTEMVITYTGHALLTILKDLVGQGMTEAFEIIRPLIAFSFQTILERSNNIFELVTTSPIKEESLDKIMEDEEAEGVHLRLRGQMLLMEEWNMILFLANPVMTDVASLTGAGIFINDLSLHDCSRDLVLAGTQQSVELKLALDQEQLKSKKLEESMKKLDEEMKRTDELLYQMIPKQVADRLRTGENAVHTCEVFDQVSILFSDVVTFTDICSKITPMQVVAMLNHMYSLFDQLTERNGVYKVETIGDSYMVVCGAPVKDKNHAERVADMAMDMIDASQAIKDPNKEGEHLKLRVGCHSRMVVAGVVGIKMPRYCLFGDAVNTASRMESTSEKNRIQVSEFLCKLLPPTYKYELRGTVNVKGKGEMNTYWLLGRDSRVPLSKVQAGSFDWTEPTTKQERKYSKSSDKGSRKSSVISVSSDTTTGKSREATPSPTPTPVVAAPPLAQQKQLTKQATIDRAPLKKSLPPKMEIPQAQAPPKIIKTPAPSEEAPKPTKQASTEDSKGNQINLNTAGKEIYRSARRLSNAIRSRSPSPTPGSSKEKLSVKGQKSTEDAKGNKLELTTAGKEIYASARRLSDAIRSRSPSPTSDASAGRGRSRPTSARKSLVTSSTPKSPSTAATGSSTPKAEKRVTLVRQVTLAELPDKLAEVMKRPQGETVNIVKVTATEAKGELKKTAGTGEDIICIVPVDSNRDGNGNGDEEGDGDDQERESYLINFKMKQGRQENGGPNGFKRTINGIAVGISRIPKNEALRKKIRESKIAVVTADVLTDMGCGGFADKQKQVISQACSIL